MAHPRIIRIPGSGPGRQIGLPCPAVIAGIVGIIDRSYHPYISGKTRLQEGDIITLYTRGIWENVDEGELEDVFMSKEARIFFPFLYSRNLVLPAYP